MTNCIEAPGSTRYRFKWRDGKVYLAHRLAYCDANGLQISDIAGQVVRHSCDNPACIQPAHLSLGTQQDNMNDKVDRQRQAKGSAHGMAELTEDIVRYIKEHYKRRCKEFGGRALATRFGVHESTVSDIMLGHTWGHV